MLNLYFELTQGLMAFYSGLSFLGCIELTSVGLIIYYIYAKTRAPAIIAAFFPNLNLGEFYENSLFNFSTIRKDGETTGSQTMEKEYKPWKDFTHGMGTQNILAITPHACRTSHKPTYFDLGVYFPYVAQSLRTKRFSYPQVSKCVLNDPILQRAVRQVAEETLRELKANDDADELDETKAYQIALKQQERRAVSLILNMHSTLNNLLLQSTCWLLYKLLPRFLSGVVTQESQIKMLQAAAQRSPGVPFIFLPLHRSHLDYLLVTFILINYDMRSPLVAAGNNLQIPVFGSLLRGLGAFFIKRKIDPIAGKKDILYRAVLQLYIQHALKLGHNMEFFIEGGRTRTGKPCMPKAGILSVIVSAFMDHSISDALLVPVSVNYERLVDGNFVREQKGENKVPESFGSAMMGIWQALNSNYGLIRIDFNEPYSLRELVQSFDKLPSSNNNSSKQNTNGKTPKYLHHTLSTSSLFGTDVVCEEQRSLIESISRQVVYDCAASTSIMSTNALAFLLLTRFRDGAAATQIAAALDDLQKSLYGKHNMGFAGNSLHVVLYASDLLKDLVIHDRQRLPEVVIKRGPRIEQRIELAYYSNMLAPHFALESILIITFHDLLPAAEEDSNKKPSSSEKNRRGISRKSLLEAAMRNCDVFRYEFILCKPTQDLQNEFEQALDEVLMKELVQLPKQEESEYKMRAKRIAAYLDADENDDVASNCSQDTLDMFYADHTINEQRALAAVLAPFSHTYLAVAESLTLLYQNQLLETEFIKRAMEHISAKVESGKCPYEESVSTDSVRNCIKLLEKWSALQICNVRGVRLIALGHACEGLDDISNIESRISCVVPKAELC